MYVKGLARQKDSTILFFLKRKKKKTEGRRAREEMNRKEQPRVQLLRFKVRTQTDLMGPCPPRADQCKNP